MAKVSVDGNLCVGCGICIQSCSDVFKMGDEGVAEVIEESIGSTSCDLNDIASQCPVDAIIVEE